MHILLLPGALKGTLSAVKAGQILSRHLQPKHTVRCFPVADGGDGFIDTFAALCPQAVRVNLRAKNAFLQTKSTSYLWVPARKTAVIETARVCGLGRAKPGELDPLGASSFGVGQVIKHAVKRGAKKIYIGLGGVACSDGGAGMCAACGAKLFDKNGAPLALGAQALLHVARVDVSELQQQLKGVEIIGAADVTNPLVGPVGSAAVFGPQKGATPAQVSLLEKALARWARVVYKTTGRNAAHAVSAAAAGGIAAGLYACLGGDLLLGADFLLQKARLDKQVQWADLLITSEGKLDAQTFYGKAPLAVLKLAKKYGKPVLFICGSADWNALAKRNLRGVQVAELVDFAPSVQAARQHAGNYLARVCQSV